MDKAGEILKGFFAFYGLEKGEKYLSFFSRWRQLVGDDLASHSRVADIRRGAAVVEVDHPGWMQLLQMREEDILKKIGRDFPDLGIRTLQMRLVPEGKLSAGSQREGESEITKERPPSPSGARAGKEGPSPLEGAPEPKAPPGVPLKPEEASPDSPLAGIRDPQLQELLGRLEKSLGKKTKDPPS